MTDYTDKAAGVLAALQDYARDIEADLGKQARATSENPNWNHVQQFTDPGATLADYEARKDRFPDDTPRLAEYRRLVSGAEEHINRVGAPKTSAERAAFQEAKDLRIAIQDIQTHADAQALVATFEEA